MSLRNTLSLIGVFFINILTIQAVDFRITSFSGNGDLTWADTNTNGTYTVQWCSSLIQSNWSSDWTGLTQVAATGGAIRVNVPMFFRVIHRPRQSQSANMRLVSGGGQPQGPQYDFYVAKYEVSNDEYAQFLNDAQAHQGDARGSNMVFADNGDVAMHDDSWSWQFAILFDASNSRLLYNKNAPVGSRYSVYADYIGHPIVGVSWFGAVKYCNWLTIKEGRGEGERCYSEGSNPTNWHPANLNDAQWADGFEDWERLDWVNSCSGFRLLMDHNGSSGANYFNEFYKVAAWNGASNVLYGFGRNIMNAQDANYGSSGDPYEAYSVKTTPVGYYDGSLRDGVFQTRTNANVYAVYDLSGNVTEWMTDHQSTYGGNTLRGGSWANDIDLTTTTTSQTSPQWTSTHIGFRVASSEP